MAMGDMEFLNTAIGQIRNTSTANISAYDSTGTWVDVVSLTNFAVGKWIIIGQLERDKGDTKVLQGYIQLVKGSDTTTIAPTARGPGDAGGGLYIVGFADITSTSDVIKMRGYKTDLANTATLFRARLYAMRVA